MARLRLYLAQQVGSLADGEGRGWLVLLWGSAWAMLRSHFGNFPASNPVFWISMFWAMDWILGSILAWRQHKWSPKRAAFSVYKWLLWMFALAVAWGLRDAAFLGASLIAGFMEAAILLAEGSSVLRNAAHLSDNRMAKRILNRFATAAEGRIDALEARLAMVEEKKEVGSEAISGTDTTTNPGPGDERSGPAPVSPGPMGGREGS